MQVFISPAQNSQLVLQAKHSVPLSIVVPVGQAGTQEFSFSLSPVSHDLQKSKAPEHVAQLLEQSMQTPSPYMVTFSGHVIRQDPLWRY